jgi:hypothetical protein
MVGRYGVMTAVHRPYARDLIVAELEAAIRAVGAGRTAEAESRLRGAALLFEEEEVA